MESRADLDIAPGSYEEVDRPALRRAPNRRGIEAALIRTATTGRAIRSRTYLRGPHIARLRAAGFRLHQTKQHGVVYSWCEPIATNGSAT